jgi:hypothetical protein
MKEVFDMAGAVLTAISKDEHERAKALSRRKAETDLISNMLTERENGRVEALTSVIRKMKSINRPYEEISLITGLSILEIEKL